jgi:WD40 repeat protein
MPDRNRFSAAEQALIARIEKLGVSLEESEHGWGFFNASDKVLKLIKGIAGVQFLDLFESCEADEVSDKGLAQLKGLSKLRYLALGPGISDKGLAHLAALTELRELRLDSASDVTDDGLQYLAKLTKLESLTLQYTEVAGAGFTHLYGLKKLKELNLEGTPVTQEAVAVLEKALPKCKIIWDPAKAPKTPKKGQGKAASVASDGYQLKLRATLRGHPSSVKDAAFSPDGALLASREGSKIVLWDSATCAKLRSIQLKQNTMWGAAFTSDGKLIAAGTNGCCVMVWDTASGKEKLCLETPTRSFWAVDTDPQGKYLAAGGDGDNGDNGDKIYLWELPHGKLLHTFQAGDILAVAFSPDGKTLASCGRASAVFLWNVPAGSKKQELQGPAHKTQYEAIRDLAFSPDGTTLAAAHPDCHVRLWNLAKGKELTAMKHPNPVLCLAFHPDGRTLVTGSDGDTLLRRWDVSTGKCVAEFETNAVWYINRQVNVVAFSPDGKTLVTNGKGGSLLLLDV